MKQSTYTILSGVVFAAFCAAHLSRLIIEWPASIGLHTIPTAISWIVVVLSGYLSYSSIIIARKSKKK
jgi:ABC-type lipoprotein release transport system permease subunit